MTRPKCGLYLVRDMNHQIGGDAGILEAYPDAVSALCSAQRLSSRYRRIAVYYKANQRFYEVLTFRDGKPDETNYAVAPSDLGDELP